MKQRPILFSAPMVRALLDGSKTQTRRICKNAIYSNGYGFVADNGNLLCHNDYLPPSATLMDVKRGGINYTTSDHEGWEDESPYGQVGDQLWVRETWGNVSNSYDEAGNAVDWIPDRPATPIKEMPYGRGYYCGQVIYRADGEFECGWTARSIMKHAADSEREIESLRKQLEDKQNLIVELIAPSAPQIE